MQNDSGVSVPQVGAVVEVKNQDGVYQEATINKLTDASIYTVGKSITDCLLYLLALRLTLELQQWSLCSAKHHAALCFQSP